MGIRQAGGEITSGEKQASAKPVVSDRDRERLAAHVDEASRHWFGAHLFAEIVASGSAPCMDWYTISIPQEELGRPDDVLKTTVFHEFGHRTISPESPETARIWQLLVLRTLKEELDYPGEIRTDVHHLIVNMVTDLWVDRHYLEDGRTSGFYAEATKLNIGAAERRMKDFKSSKKESDTGYDDEHAEDLFQLFLELYRANLAAAKGRSLFWKDPRAETAFRDIFDPSKSAEERIVAFTRTVKDLIPIYTEYAPLFRVNGALVDRTTEAYPVDKVRFIRRLKSGGCKAGGPELKGVFGLKDGAAIFAMIKEMELYARVVDTVDLVHRAGTRRRQFAGFTRWRVGHRLPDLLFERSLERYGRVIPNVNTLKKNFMIIGSADENKGQANICLIVDDSGSMGCDDRLNRLQESLFALILAAEKRQDPVSLIVFGSDVTHKQAPSYDYRLLKTAVASLDCDSGGTVLAPAIREACRLAHTVERQTTFLFTDTEVFDGEKELKAEIGRLVPVSRLVIFAFSEDERQAAEFTNRLPEGDGIRTFFVNQGYHFYESSLKEIYHA